MNARASMSAVLLVASAACSSPSSGSFTPGGNGSGSASGGGASSSGSGPSSSSGAGGSSSGASSGGSSSGASSGGSSSGSRPADAGTPGLLYDGSAPANDLGTPVTLTMSPFTVTAANPEVYKCQWFGNPFKQDADLVKMEGHMSSGSHHFFLFNMAPATNQTTAKAISDCPQGGLEFYPFPYLSQQPDWTVTYPQANMGYPLLAGNGLMMNVHYLNTSGSDITPTVSITLYPAKPGVVTVKVGTIFLNNQKINVPASTPQSSPIAITDSLAPITDEDYTIFTNWSHMHKYSIDFTSSVNGAASFYEEKQWDEPPLQTATAQNAMLPLKVSSGSTISWKCMYYNPTSQAMTFGESANATDMCIYMGQYYPADGTPSTNANYPDIISGFNF
jgi:hypothetical protein